MPSTAQPRQSKPGPRFATVAGAKVLTDLKTGSGSAATRGLEGKEKLHLSFLGEWRLVEGVTKMGLIRG